MHTWIHTPTPDLQHSLEFYRKLGFKILSENEPCHVTDGLAFIEINPDRFARAGLKFYADNWKNEVGQLGSTMSHAKIQDGYLLRDFNGIWVYLIENAPPEAPAKSDTSFALTGNFSGLSIETTDIQKSLDVWKVLGFNEQMGSPEQGWAGCSNADGLTISFMKPLTCPHLFFNPSLTYFNGKEGNPKVIKSIRELEIPITEEITYFNKE